MSMKLTADVRLNLNTPTAKKQVENAARLGLRDTIVAIHGDVVRPPSPVLTGNNRRSIAAEVSGMGVVMQGDSATPERVVDDSKLESACYSTSGYGGYLEVGTSKMPARPYFRPALDTHGKDLAGNIKRHMD